MATKWNSWKCCMPRSRGAVLVLALSALLYAVHWFVYHWQYLLDHLRVWLDCAHYVLRALLLVTGWVAESWLGRYRAIFVGLLLLTIVFVLLNIDMDQIPAFVLAIRSLVFGTCGIGGFYTIMLPFTLDQIRDYSYYVPVWIISDQIIGASAEEPFPRPYAPPPISSPRRSRKV